MNTKTVLACTAVVIAFALIIAPLAISEDAFAKKKSNNSHQSISQHQSNHQSSQSVGGFNFLSGNNVNVQSQHNSGSNAAGQSND